MKNIALFGNYGVDNRGDDLILSGLLQKEFLNDDEWRLSIRLFCGDPAYFNTQTINIEGLINKESSKNLFIKAFLFFPGGMKSILSLFWSTKARNEYKRSCFALRSCSEAFIGGGGIIVDKHPSAVCLWFLQLFQLSLRKVPFHFVGISIELKYWWSKYLFLPFFKRSKSISVRDQSSKKFLQKYGIKSHLCSDYALYSPLLKTIHQDNFSVVSDKKSKTLVVSCCSWGLTLEKKNLLKEFFKKKKDEGWRIVPLAFQSRGDDDRKILSELLPGEDIITNLSLILKHLSKANMVFAMRYHAVLLSLYYKRKLIVLPYQKKVHALLADNNAQMLSICLDNLSREVLNKQFDHAMLSK